MLNKFVKFLIGKHTNKVLKKSISGKRIKGKQQQNLQIVHFE